MGPSPPIWLGIGKNSAAAGGGPIDPAAIGTTARRARLAAIRLDQTGGRREDRHGRAEAAFPAFLRLL